MALYAIGHNQIGASHVKHDIVCQDAYLIKWIKYGEILTVSVADGHGSSACLHSEEGSKIATEVFCDNMEKLYAGYKNNLIDLESYLYKEGSEFIARRIVRDWQEQVKERHLKEGRAFPMISKQSVPDDEQDSISTIEDESAPNQSDEQVDEQELFHMYGTTLVGMLITPEFHFAFQVGDGDITCVVNGEAYSVLESDQMLGVETHSLCEKEPWKYARSTVKDIEDSITEYAYILTTDGFKNSHATDEDYLRSCLDYISMVKTYGLYAVKANLEGWLEETSQYGCGDDITVALITSFDKVEGYAKTLISEENDTKETTVSTELTAVLAEEEQDQTVTTEETNPEIIPEQTETENAEASEAEEICDEEGKEPQISEEQTNEEYPTE